MRLSGPAPVSSGVSLTWMDANSLAARGSAERRCRRRCQGRPSRPVFVKFGDLGSAQSDRALDFGWEVGRGKVEVQPILALAGSGTPRNISTGKVRSSEAGISAKNWLAPSLTGRSSRADQKAAISSARWESMTTWPNPRVTVVFLSRLETYLAEVHLLNG